eukprot:scaffold92846_cov33-Cyclotella_meneghiniana.AAC.1
MEPNSTTARPKRTAVANVRFGEPKSAAELTKTSDNAAAASAASTSEDIADATVTKKKKFQPPPSDSSVSDSNTSREGHVVKPSSKPKGKKRPETPPVHLLAHNIAKKPRKVPSMFNPIAARKEQQRKSREEVEEEPHVNESESEKELPEYRRDDDEYYDSESDDSDWSDSDERPPRISIYDSDSEDEEECDEDDDSYFNGLLLLVFMVEQKRQLMVSDLLDGEPPAPTDETEIGDHASNLSDTRDEDDDDLFGGLVDNQDVEVEVQNESDAQLESVCLAELDMYLRDKGMPMHSDTEKKTLNCPLEWWKVNHHKYPVLAILAETFLSIPASSAPSERIWSNAGLVIHYKRAKLAEEAASGIIFLKRNRDVLRKHYEVVTKDAEDSLPLRFSGLLDPINEEEVEMLGGINITD